MRQQDIDHPPLIFALSDINRCQTVIVLRIDLCAMRQQHFGNTGALCKMKRRKTIVGSRIDIRAMG